MSGDLFVSFVLGTLGTVLREVGVLEYPEF